MEQQLTAVSNLIFVEKKSKIDKNEFKPSHIKGCMVLSFRHQLEKTGKKMEKSGKNKYILTLPRAFIFINILAILVESEQELGKMITHTPITHYKNYVRKYLYTLDKAYQGHLNSLNRHNMDIFDYLLRLYLRQMEKRRHKSLKSPHFLN